MRTALLRIESLPDALAFHWTGPDGASACRERGVHPADLEAVVTALNAPPATPQELEALGRRIFSRLLDRDIREAAFAAPPCLLGIVSDLPAIPWDLAFDGRCFLADVHATCVSAATQPPAVVRDPHTAALSVLMVVNPNGNLPYSESEAAQVEERLRHAGRVHFTTLAGAAATRHAILDALERHAFDVLHFSCHAEHNSASPLRSHLRAYDGEVTAEDIFQAATARAPALCVLNACESGRCGGTEAVGGLAAAFRAAGARAVVGARWPVNNKSAAHAMAVFYTGLAAGETAAKSLQHARAETRRVFAHDTLLTWAAFALDGDPALRIATSGPLGQAGAAPLIGRETEWDALNAAWADARAGRARTVLLLGPAGSGKTRLLTEWLASLPSARVAALALDSEMNVAGPCIRACDGLDDADVTADDVRARPRNNRALTLLTARSWRWVAEMPDDAVILSLDPLPVADVVRMLAALDAPLPPALEAMLPGDVERMALGRPEAPATEARLFSLSDAERVVLRAGAVLGEAFSIADAAATLEQPVDAVWRPLDALCRAGWLVEENDDAMRFRRALDRATVLAHFHPRMERRALHARAARLMAQRSRPGAEGMHWREAGDTEQARNAFTSAFFTAHAEGRHAEALGWHAERLALGAAKDGCDYTAALAESLAADGQWKEARDAWMAASSQCGGAARAGVLLRLADVELKLGDSAAALRSLEAARAGGVAESALSETLRAEILLAGGHAEDALETARSAMDAARAERENSGIGRAALATAQAALLLADDRVALAACEEGIAAGEEHRTALARAEAKARQYAGDYAAAENTLNQLADTQRAVPHERAATLLALCELWRDQGRLEPALVAVREAAALGEQSAQADVRVESANLRSSVMRRQGRYADALEAADEAMALAKEAAFTPGVIRARVHRATALAETGALSEARDAAIVSIQEAQNAGYRFGTAWSQTVLGLVYLERHRPSQARTVLMEALDVSHSLRSHIGIASAHYYLGWAVWAEGAPDPEHFLQAEDAAARIHYQAVQHPAAFAKALCEGDVDTSEAALRRVEAMDMGAVAAWLRWARGDWLLARRKMEPAERDLASCYRVARRLGLRALQSRAASSLSDAYRRIGEPMGEALGDEGASLWTECVLGWDE